MEQQPQVPQFQTNPVSPTPMQPKSGSTMTVIIAGIIVLLLAMIGFVLWQKSSMTEDLPEIQDTAQESATQSELSNLENENNNQDFSSVEGDFGAEVNAVVKE